MAKSVFTSLFRWSSAPEVDISVGYIFVRCGAMSIEYSDATALPVADPDGIDRHEKHFVVRYYDSIVLAEIPVSCLMSESNLAHQQRSKKHDAHLVFIRGLTWLAGHLMKLYMDRGVKRLTRDLFSEDGPGKEW